MTITRFLWSALAGCVSIILLLVSAWAHDTTNRTDSLEQRLNISEQHYAAIQSDLQDLRDHLKEIQNSLRERQ